MIKAAGGVFACWVVLCVGSAAKTAQVTVDFGSGTRYQIPAGFLGAQLGYPSNDFYRNKSALKALRQAGFTELRVDALLHKVFAHRNKPDWSQIDPILVALRAVRLKALVVMGFTPAWLQPHSNPCSRYDVPDYHAPPADTAAWADLTVQFVRHVDERFPGLVQDYEIWNEPDNPHGLCVYPDTDSTRQKIYLDLYAAAAPQMRRQAQRDGTTIHIGGPALARPEHAGSWLSRLLTEPSVAAYLDFVSYHHYMGLGDAYEPGSHEDDGVNRLFARTVSADTGVGSTYGRFASVVAHNRGGSRTFPVFLTEFNTTAEYRPDCCRNDPTYAPVWNVLAVQQLLNSVYEGANSVPARIMYFAAQDWFPRSSPGTAWFCLFGTRNPEMDCSYDEHKSRPYPQFYAYKLLAASRFVGLAKGGYIVPITLAKDLDGLVTSAVQANGSDTVIIANPTATKKEVALNVFNVPGTPATGTFFLLNKAHPEISTRVRRISLKNGYFGTVSVPSYSVVAMKLRVASARK